MPPRAPSRKPAFWRSADTLPLMDRVLSSLSLMVEDNRPADIITFCEDPEYLGQKLFPRQRLILKIYYRLELSYAELQDARYLLECSNKYARMFFPGLTAESVVGMSDTDLAEKLRSHGANILEVIAGRRGTKSALGAFTALYELYLLYRNTSLYSTYTNLLPGQEIGIANVATTEDQALVMFKQMLALIENSKWFSRADYRAIETKLEFPGKHIVAQSLHSNSAGVRGKTLKAVFLDEYCLFNMTTGKQSDKAMWAALKPSVVTFGSEAKVIIISSPRAQSGMAYDIFSAVQKGEIYDTICFQLATWEMNPTVTREALESEYRLDADYAEMEFGAQWANQVGQEIPPEAIDACKDKDLPLVRERGEKGVRYCVHIDLAKKRDSCGLIVAHYDRSKGKVIFDRVELFNPVHGGVNVNDHHEIDQEALYTYVVDLQRRYGFQIESVTFDQFNSGWLEQKWRSYFGEDRVEELFITDRANREAYGSLRSCFVQGKIAIPTHYTLIEQLRYIGRTLKPSGAYKIEGPPGCPDDLADSAAFVCKRTLDLALGANSGIYLAESLPEFIAKQAKANVPPSAAHHPECSKSFCHYLCPVQRALQNGE